MSLPLELGHFSPFSDLSALLRWAALTPSHAYLPPVCGADRGHAEFRRLPGRGIL